MEHLWWEDYTLSWLDGNVWGGCYLDGECCLGSHSGSWLRALGLAELAGNTVLFASGSNGLCSDGLPPPWDPLLLAGGMAGDLHRGPQQRGCHDRGWQTRKKTDSVQKGYSEEAEYTSYRSSTRSIMTWRCVEFCRDVNLVGEGVYHYFLFGVEVPARDFLGDWLWQAAD